MSLTNWVMIGVVVLSVAWLVFTVLADTTASTHRRAKENLKRGLQQKQATAVGASARAKAALGMRIAPPKMITYLDRLLMLAGRPQDWPLSRVISAKVLLTAVVAAAAALLVGSVRTPMALGLAVVGTVVAFFAPDLLLWSRGMERREAIGLELPDTLDQMSIAVEAGLGFDAAMFRVSRNGKGLLAQEILRTMQDIQVGKPRREAYEDLITRTRVPPLRRFVRSIIQAESYGIALSDVLHTQAAEMRMTRRQRAEAKAMEIPVKVVIPLIVCILPALFIVILGPGIINIMESFAAP